MNPIGVMFAEMRDDKLHIGWSICHKKDIYNKEKGQMIAVNRLESEKTIYNIPMKYIKTIENFVERAEKYYKCKNDE